MIHFASATVGLQVCLSSTQNLFPRNMADHRYSDQLPLELMTAEDGLAMEENKAKQSCLRLQCMENGWVLVDYSTQQVLWSAGLGSG